MPSLTGHLQSLELSGKVCNWKLVIGVDTVLHLHATPLLQHPPSLLSGVAVLGPMKGFSPKAEVAIAPQQQF